MTHTPDVIIFSSMVMRENVHVVLTMAVLHDLEIKVADILNAYVTASIKENIWTVLDPKFGDDVGESAIIVRAICNKCRCLV